MAGHPKGTGLAPRATQASGRVRHWPAPGWVVLGILLLSALWAGVLASQHTALPHDMAEQFVWAHAWQLGYPKHPPLPTWLFMAALECLPARPATLYGLSALCIGATGVFTFLGARALLGEKAGLAVAALWSLQQPFSWRAWMYNHNTVLVACVAMTMMCLVLAVQADEDSGHRGYGWWLAAGLGAGLALDTKLQALVPLAGMLWALWRSGALDSRRAINGLGCAVAAATLLSAAPLWWMLSGHTNGLAYARHQFDATGPAHPLRFVTFVVSALRMLSPALLMLLLWAVLGRRMAGQQAPPAPGGQQRPATLRAWGEGLVLLPLLATLASGLLGAATLHAQWGVQAFQFMAIGLVIWQRDAIARLPARRMLLCGAVVHALSLGLAGAPPGAGLHAPGAAQGYPAASLANRVQQDWARVAGPCPLRYVSGPFFEAGQLSAYLPSHPVVLEDGDHAKSPWVNTGDMARAGSVRMASSPAALPARALHEATMVLTPDAWVKGVGTVYWAIVPPTGSGTNPCQR